MVASPHITLTFLSSFLFSITYLWPGVRIGEKAIGREGAFGCLFYYYLVFLSLNLVHDLTAFVVRIFVIVADFSLASAFGIAFSLFFQSLIDTFSALRGRNFRLILFFFLFLDLRLSGVASVLGFPEQILLLSSCPSPPLFHFIFQLDCVAFFFFNSPRYQSYEHDLFFFFKLLELYLQITRVLLFFYC